MDFTLRPLTEADAPELQGVYAACPAAFTSLLGRPAPPGQAAADLGQARTMPGRYLFGVAVDGALIGLVDCKREDEVAGQVHIGLLLLAAPYDDPEIGGLALRIAERWLANTGVSRIETGVLAHLPAQIAFWAGQGYAFTGEQYRRELPGYAPRFLVMGKTMDGGRPTSIC